MDVKRKSIGILIDDLCTTSNKLWHLQDDVDGKGPNKLTDAEIAGIFKRVQTLNIRRNALINAIDEILDPFTASTTEKTYH
jgi:hypothetical protein